MLAIGVRSSCAAVDRNSLFMRSTSTSCETSRKYSTCDTGSRRPAGCRFRVRAGRAGQRHQEAAGTVAAVLVDARARRRASCRSPGTPPPACCVRSSAPRSAPRRNRPPRTADADHVEECRTDILDAPMTIEGNESVRTERKDCIELSPYRLEILQRTGRMRNSTSANRSPPSLRQTPSDDAPQKAEHLIDRLAHDEGHPEFGQALEAEDAIHVVDRRQPPIIPLTSQPLRPGMAAPDKLTKSAGRGGVARHDFSAIPHDRQDTVATDTELLPEPGKLVRTERNHQHALKAPPRAGWAAPVTWIDHFPDTFPSTGRLMKRRSAPLDALGTRKCSRCEIRPVGRLGKI